MKILSRIFRNLDDINDFDTVKLIFDFIVDKYCKLFFLLLCEVKNAGEEFVGFETLFKAVEELAPNISLSFLYEALGHRNLRKLIIDAINDIESKDKRDVDEYKLFVLYMLIIQNNLEDELDLISKLISVIEKDPIKGNIAFALYKFIIEKAYGNKTLETALKNKIKELGKKERKKYNLKYIDEIIAENNKRSGD